MMRNLGGGKWECTVCGYISKSTNVKYHIESKHMSAVTEYSCTVCGDILKTRNALNTHMSYKHRNQNLK